MLENADKSFGLECSPTDPRDAFPVDLRDASVRARVVREGGLAPDRLEAIAADLPHCVPFRYNRQTRRGAAFGPPPAGAFGVLLLGDSFTEGAGVVAKHTFARRLETLLAHGQRRALVHNGGRRGRDLPALVEDLERFLPLVEPDLVIYVFMLNDFEQGRAHRARQVFLNDLVLDRQCTGRPTWKLPGILQASRLATALAAWWRRRTVTAETIAWYRGMTGPDNREGWERTRRDLARMNDLATRSGARFLVAVLPVLTGLDGDGNDYPFTELHRDLCTACRKLGIRCVDLLEAFTGRPAAHLWVHPVDMHPNDEAHRIIAEALAPIAADMLGQGPGE